jgi:septal ring factor EnvC (AmiA/AmiB activator)
MDTVGVLEHKRSQLENIIESVQKELEVINKRLAKMERTKRKARRRRLN